MNPVSWRRNFRRFRADNRYSYPILFFIVDITLSLLKVLAAVLALAIVWSVASRFSANTPKIGDTAVIEAAEITVAPEVTVAKIKTGAVAVDELKVAAVVETARQQQESPVEEAKKPESPEVVGKSTLLDQSWTLKQEDGFTVQLGSSTEKSKLVEFASAINVGEQLHLYPFKISSLGNPIYGLAFGVYPDFKTAERAVAQLPAALREYKPWIRPIGILQNQIRTATRALK